MKTKHWMRTTQSLGAILLAATLSTAHAAPDRNAMQTNIVFIFSDDHSIQTIGAYGARLSEFCRQQNVTPNLDRLAASGGLFLNSFCGNSLCSPSRAAVLTGLHSHANGVMLLDKPITPGVWTFPGNLRDAGYQTAMIGKFHLASTRPTTDYWRILPGQGNYWHPDFIGPQGREKHEGYTTDILTDMGLEWLKQRDKTKPFMLMLQHKAPHRPWVPPPRYYRWLADVKIPEPETLFDDYSGRASPAHNQKMEIARDMTLHEDLKMPVDGKSPGENNRMTESERVAWQAAFGPRNEAFAKASLQGRELTRWKYQEYMKDYLRCIKAVDDSVGRVLEYLKTESLEENTVVIYSSDQGFYNGEHGWFDKRWIYEESIHMPFIIRWPGVVKPDTRFTPMIQNIDYAATFLDIAGGKIPEGLHGRSFAPILRGQTPADWRQSIYYHYYDGGHSVAKHYGVRTDRFTLAHFYETGEWELYDREKDPQELKSVYADPAYAKTVAELKTELDRLRKQYKDSDDIKPAGKPNQPASAPEKKAP